jgi:hypothetical protein
MNSSDIFSKTCLLSVFCIAGLAFFSGCVSPSGVLSGSPTVQATTATPAPTAAETPVQTTAAATTVAAAATTEGTLFLKYTSPSHGFSIDYPSDWEVAEITSDPDLDDPGFRVVEFYSPSILRCNTDSQCVYVRAKVSIDVDETPFTDELEEYYVKDVARITTASGVEITRKQAKIVLSKAKAYSFDYIGTDEYGGIKVLRAYTLIGDNGYIITYTAHSPKNKEADMFTQYYNDVQHMMDSFAATGSIRTI